MRNLILNQDLKSLFQGAALAVVGGLTMGAAMTPELKEGALQGPQLEAGVSGVRYENHGGVALTSYGDRVPDYVIGLDWLKPPPEAPVLSAVYDEEPLPEDAESVAFLPEPTAPPEPRVWDEAAQPVSYPSLAGGVAYASDLPAPPEPPAG